MQRVSYIGESGVWGFINYHDLRELASFWINQSLQKLVSTAGFLLIPLLR